MQQEVIAVQSLSKILKDLRIGEGLTQEMLAGDLGLTRYMVSYYEGGREPSLDVLVAYAKRFHVSTDYLLGLTVEKTHHLPDIAAMLSKVASFTAADGVAPIYMENISYLLMSISHYYLGGAPAGHMPLEVVRNFLCAMPQLLDAMAQNDTAATLDGVNKVALVALSANQVLQQYLSKQ